jgi:hypothetical protein
MNTLIQIHFFIQLLLIEKSEFQLTAKLELIVIINNLKNVSGKGWIQKRKL